MSSKKNIVALSPIEREELEKASRSNQRSMREKKRARVLLLADVSCSREQGASRTDGEIAGQLACARLTVSTVRGKACQRGAVAAITHGAQQKRKGRKLDGRQEAQLIALACSTAPEGHKRWTLQLLAKKLVEIEHLDGLAPETVRQLLKKTSSNPG